MLEVQSTQKGLIGKDSIKSKLDNLDDRLKVAGSIKGGARLGMDCLVLGDSGTGKNFVARLLAGKMLSSGAIKTPPKVVDAADWADFSGDFDKKMAALKDGVLILTNAQKVVPTTKATDVNQLDNQRGRSWAAASTYPAAMAQLANQQTGGPLPTMAPSTVHL